MMTEERYDIVVFGVTGFTGLFVVEELAHAAGNKTWAIAGRSEAKLNSVLEAASANTGIDVKHIPKIIADVNDENSMQQMARQARVVVNCVGPYRYLGEQAVRACVQNGASHVDLSGEPQYLETMQLRYHSEARAKGVYIIGCCGFGAIPLEMGLVFTKQQFKGDLHGVDAFLEFQTGPQGTSLHFATLQSNIYVIETRNEMADIRKQIMPQKMPESKHKVVKKSGLFHDNRVNGWCIPMLGADKDVIDRSQYYDYFERKRRPVAVNMYMKARSFVEGCAMRPFGAMFNSMAKHKTGRNLLEKHPKLFTAGYFSHEGPTREQLKDTTFTWWFFGQGWKSKLDNPDELHPETPDQFITCRVDGRDPGYAGTSVCLIGAAMTILDDVDKLPKGGGVYPPGAAFADTRIYQRLQERGITFTVVSQ